MKFIYSRNASIKKTNIFLSLNYGIHSNLHNSSDNIHVHDFINTHTHTFSFFKRNLSCAIYFFFRTKKAEMFIKFFKLVVLFRKLLRLI